MQQPSIATPANLNHADIETVEISGIGRICRNQLVSLWQAVTAEENLEDRAGELMDLTQMNVQQLRQLHGTLNDMCGVQAAPVAAPTTPSLGRPRLSPIWRINEAAFQRLVCVGKPWRGLECAICCQDIVEVNAVTLPCASVGCASFFHARCIRPWLERRPNCPLCRADAAELVVQDPSVCDSNAGSRHATSGAISNAVSSARFFSNLCRLQASQNARQVLPSASGSVIVGLFNQAGPRVIQRGDLLSWLRENDGFEDQHGSNNANNSSSSGSLLTRPAVSVESVLEHRVPRRPVSASSCGRLSQNSADDATRFAKMRLSQRPVQAHSAMASTLRTGLHGGTLRLLHHAQSQMHDTRSAPHRLLQKPLLVGGSEGARLNARLVMPLGRTTSLPVLAASGRGSS